MKLCSPSQHLLIPGSCFVLKMGEEFNSVCNEISILNEFWSSNCSYLLEIVWSPSGGQQLGIVPCGKPIEFREVQSVSCKIVTQLMDGLEFLHNLGIVHRDIHPSNLILHSSKSGDSLVIIDYENAVLVEEVSNRVDYFGGYISWPIKLLKSNDSIYIPRAEDDLFASILVVLHMLYSHSISVHSLHQRSEQLVQMNNFN